MKNLLLILFLFFQALVNAQIISTVAGNGLGGYGGDGNPATNASIGGAGGIVFDVYGNYYFAEDNNSIRKVSSSGIISTIAGNGVTGNIGDGGSATAAEFNGPSFVAMDDSGNLFISDFYNNKIRKINFTTGIITTIAGNGIGTYGGDGGQATAASLYSPDGIAFDSYNNLYISDDANGRIRKVNTAGIITTIAGGGGGTTDGIQATSANISTNGGIWIDKYNNLYYCDNNKIRKINLVSGIINTVTGNGSSGFGGDGGLATNAELFFPRDIIVDAFGNMYISDVDNNRIRMVNSSGIINTIVGNGAGVFYGDGGPASAAEVYSPRGLALDSCSNLYIVDNGNYRIRKVAYSTCNALGSTEITNNNEISIYPNPVYDELNITNLKTPATYRLLSIVGAAAQQGTLKQGNNTISIQSIPNGMYMLEIIPLSFGEGQGEVVTKIVKQ